MDRYAQPANHFDYGGGLRSDDSGDERDGYDAWSFSRLLTGVEEHEKAILSTLEDMGRVHCGSPQPPPYSSSPPPSLSPAPSAASSSSLSRRRLGSFRLEKIPTSTVRRKRLPTPPSSVDERPFDCHSRRASSVDEDVSPFEYHSYLARSPSQTTTSSVYADSPTLGRRDSFAPVRIAPLHIPASPLGSETSLVAPLSSTWSELEVARGAGVRRKRISMVAPPSPGGLIPIEYDTGSLIPVETENLTEEFGVRPGEREVLADFFADLKLRASDTGSMYGNWDECVVRVYRNEVSGQYRIVTVRGKHIDQRNIPPETAELIPEYAYHENCPVIFLRKAGPGMYSKQSGPKGSRKSPKSGDAPAASLHYKFSSLYDMFTFQQAFLGETVESDVQNTRSIRYTRGFRDGEHTYSRARVQLWKEPSKPTEVLAGNRSREWPGSIGSSTRARGSVENIVRPTRLVMYLDYIAMCLFVTDDLAVSIPHSHPKTLKIRPSSHRAFNNPSHVKACVLGNRSISGGFRLDKDGLGIDVQDAFDDVKWFEIDFASEAECRAFHQDITVALQQRRKERRLAEELKRQAAHGVRAGEAFRQPGVG